MPSMLTPSARRQRGLPVGSFPSSLGRYPDSQGKDIPSTITAFGPSRPMTPNGGEKSMTPRPVTPSSHRPSSETSWEDYDEGLYGSAQKARRNKTSHHQGTSFEEDEIPQPRTTSISYDEEEMPMDELLAVTPRKETIVKTPSVDTTESPVQTTTVSNNNNNNNIGKITAALESNSFERPTGLNLEERMLWDAVQSTIINALRRSHKANSASGGHKEFELEKKLTAAETTVEELNQKIRLLEQQQPGTEPLLSSRKMIDLEGKLKEAEMSLQNKESEHDVELRAIQRVLAEMTVAHEDETQVLNETVTSLSKTIETLEKEKAVFQRGLPPPPPPPSPPKENNPRETDQSKEMEKLKEMVKGLETENATIKKEAERKARQVNLLERDLKSLKAQLKTVEGGKTEPADQEADPQVEALVAELAKTKERNSKLQAELDASRKSKRKPYGSMTPPRPEMTSNHDCESVASSMSAEDVESLQKNLTDTTSSLENAKKIIASLENANGSMAVDLRAKFKAKEDELAAVQKESAERKRILDSLATELRDLQKKQDDVDRLHKESKAHMVRHKALIGLLEKSISGLQAASAIHEVSTATGEPDRSNVEQISEILTDAMLAIRTSLEMSEHFIDEFDDETTVGYTDVEVSSEVGRQIDAIIKNDREVLAQNLRNELDQKRIVVRRLEDTLQKQSEEIRRLRRENASTGGNQELLDEIKNLRDQCMANLEILAKKDLELSVLRSSLKVDESDGGYISDDASEGDEDNNGGIAP